MQDCSLFNYDKRKLGRIVASRILGCLLYLYPYCDYLIIGKLESQLAGSTSPCYIASKEPQIKRILHYFHIDSLAEKQRVHRAVP
jgi:hypothetical protein